MSFAPRSILAASRRALIGAGMIMAASVVPAWAQPQPAPAAPATDELGAAYSGGMQSFQAGEYEKAITAFETIISKAGEGAELETIYYMLGAAYFNAEEYPRAVQTLKEYLTKFPKAANRTEALESLGLAALRMKDYPSAIEAFGQLEKIPAYRAEALLNGATARKEAGQPDAAVATLKTLLAQGVNDTSTAAGAMLLASIYAEKGDADKAIETLGTLREQTRLLDNVVRLNAQAVELGDKFLGQEKPVEALACYQIVQSRDEVIRQQKARLDVLRQQVATNLTALRADPRQAPRLVAQNNAITKRGLDAQKQLADFEKLPDFQPGLWLRIGRSYAEIGEKWKAVTVYDELLRKFPDAPERESALYGLIVASADANRDPAKIRALGNEYFKAFPTGPNAAVIGYLMGATALQADDTAEAETLFGRMLETQKDSSYREEMRFLLGNARFAQSKYPEARKDYDTYLKDYPTGKHVEEVVYRTALSSLFTGDYANAAKEFAAYLGKYPQGSFRSDVKYRQLVCDYAASKYPEVIAGSVAWEKEFGEQPLLGEVLALEADALAAEDKTPEALALYIRSYKAANTEEVLSYSLLAAQKILQHDGDWEQMTAMLDAFVKDHPQSPTAITAIYWISKAKVRDGKIDEARQYVADAVRKFIDEPARESVEQLLTQLAQLCARGTADSPAPADPAAELDKLLGGADQKSPLAQARRLYARAELAVLKKQPAEEAKDLQEIADKIPPATLSAALLARVGDYLVGKGDLDKAEKYYNLLLENFLRSDFTEYAYNGLGQVAYGRGKYQLALDNFSDAIEKGAASATLKDVTLGKARALLALGRLDEAKKMFEQVASVRQWRGDSTAFSVYSLGEIEQRQGKLPEAIAYYQRVFVAYRKFLPWVAKSYVKSAECFEKLGQTKEAANTYREMLRNENLASFPEYKLARERLDKLGNG